MAGRPEKPINWDLLDNLLMADCSASEIAPHFDMHYETLYDRVRDKYGMKYTEYAGNLKQKGESLLRSTQFARAVGFSKKGDNTMLIWLGKQRLNQKEPEATIHTPPNDGKLDALIESLKAKKETPNDCKSDSEPLIQPEADSIV